MSNVPVTAMAPVRILGVDDYEDSRRWTCSKLGLPDLNGIDAARRICQLLRSTKIIFLTQNVDVDVIKAAMSNGARGYIVKADAASAFACVRGGHAG
jgi:DNA-binding NarL/FixJ family response regulator